MFSKNIKKIAQAAVNAPKFTVPLTTNADPKPVDKFTPINSHSKIHKFHGNDAKYRKGYGEYVPGKKYRGKRPIKEGFDNVDFDDMINNYITQKNSLNKKELMEKLFSIGNKYISIKSPSSLKAYTYRKSLEKLSDCIIHQIYNDVFDISQVVSITRFWYAWVIQKLPEPLEDYLVGQLQKNITQFRINDLAIITYIFGHLRIESDERASLNTELAKILDILKKPTVISKINDWIVLKCLYIGVGDLAKKFTAWANFIPILERQILAGKKSLNEVADFALAAIQCHYSSDEYIKMLLSIFENEIKKAGLHEIKPKDINLFIRLVCAPLNLSGDHPQYDLFEEFYQKLSKIMLVAFKNSELSDRVLSQCIKFLSFTRIKNPAYYEILGVHLRKSGSEVSFETYINYIYNLVQTRNINGELFSKYIKRLEDDFLPKFERVFTHFLDETKHEIDFEFQKKHVLRDRKSNDSLIVLNYYDLALREFIKIIWTYTAYHWLNIEKYKFSEMESLCAPIKKWVSRLNEFFSNNESITFVASSSTLEMASQINLFSRSYLNNCQDIRLRFVSKNKYRVEPLDFILNKIETNALKSGKIQKAFCSVNGFEVSGKLIKDGSLLISNWKNNYFSDSDELTTSALMKRYFLNKKSQKYVEIKYPDYLEFCKNNPKIPNKESINAFLNDFFTKL